MTLAAPHYPIIYVRGYAATMSEIEETVATPYMGFNLGATKVRQDYEGDIVRFIFESPLIRLMKDEGYRDTYRDGDLIPRSERVTPKSVWIFRYYEPVSKDLGEGERRTIPRFATDLRKFILRVRDQVCGDDTQARDSFKVYLVAHSMGGLVCRCYLQNICRNGARDAFEDAAEVGNANARLELEQLPADPLVDKVFTYATPHNGIDMAGLNIPDLGVFDRLHVRNFNRSHMREYLALPADEGPVNSLEDASGDDAFPVDRFFCFIGTNYRDYSAFFGLSKKGTGPMSDGLVMMENASVKGAPRAFAHRSHSGHYGIVNSEEGYQNLRRFLFGNVRADVTLLVDEITLPKAIEDEVGDNRERVRAAYNIEASATLRGLNVFLNERRVAQESAIRRTYEQLVHEQKSVYLFSGYLLKAAKTERSRDTALAFAVDLGMQVPVYEVDRRFWLDDHFEGGYVFQDVVTFHLRPTAQKTTVRYGLASASGAGVANRPLEPRDLGDGRLRFELP
ncbi:MAG: hypothetical protein OEU09_11425, partial [Rhodospirillales bacterium]|nr:hypothetical protein [Rhodospirillales bacterium]